MGYNALHNNTTGNDNVAVGHDIVNANTTADLIRIGHQSLYTVNGDGSSGSNNTVIGTNGTVIICPLDIEMLLVGNNAGERITTGYQNTVVGNIANV